jgi:hypothetical protein
MAKMRAPLRFVIAALGVCLAAAFTAPAMAQQQKQPTEVNPMAQSVKERELLKELNKIQGRSSLPDARTRVLEQPAGRDWRQFHQVTLRWVAAIAILGMLAVLILFYLIRGMVRIENGRSGRTLVRFNAFERFVHWMTASCFIVLALSGLNITFGRELLTPLFGPEMFATWSQWAKYAHNYLSFPFTLGVVLMFLMWIAWNFPSGVDVRWLRDGHRLPSDVPLLLLYDRRREHAVGADDTRHCRRGVHCDHAGPYLHRHHRHAGCLRGHGQRRGGRQLGPAASQPVAGERNPERPGQRRSCGAGRVSDIAFPNESGRMRMRTFFFACLAAVLIAAGAAYVLNNLVPDTSAGAFSTQGVRI